MLNEVIVINDNVTPGVETITMVESSAIKHFNNAIHNSYVAVPANLLSCFNFTIVKSFYSKSGAVPINRAPDGWSQFCLLYTSDAADE